MTIKLCNFFHVFGILLLSLTLAHGATSVSEMEEGGPCNTPAIYDDVPTLAQGNLARAEDAVAFGSPTFESAADPKFQTIHLNDGHYGYTRWAAARPGADTGEFYVGIYFEDGLQDIQEFALGSDNIAGENVASPCGGGNCEFQYTTETFEVPDPTDGTDFDIGVLNANWISCGNLPAPQEGSPTNLRRRYRLDSMVSVRAIRVIVGLNLQVDELEVGLDLSVPGGECADPVPQLVPLGEPGGPCITPANIPDVPTAIQGNLSRLAEARAFGTLHHPNSEGNTINQSRYSLAHLNDGRYGHFRSWLGWENGFTSNLSYVGIKFDSLRTITKIAFGRDNIGEETDSASGINTIEYTLQDFDLIAGDPRARSNLPADTRFNHEIDDDEISDVDWIKIGSAPASFLRQLYEVPNGGVNVRAIRMITTVRNIIDEFEVGGPLEISEQACEAIFIPDLVLIEAEEDPLPFDGVPTFEDGNLTQLNITKTPDVLTFGTRTDLIGGYKVEEIIDGLYRDIPEVAPDGYSAWFALMEGRVSRLIYVGIYFPGGPQEIADIAMGGDSTGPDRCPFPNPKDMCPHSPFTRTDSRLLVEFSEDDFSNVPLGPSDTRLADLGISWTPIGYADPTGLRHRWRFPDGPVEATAIRVCASNGHILDEVELYADTLVVGCNTSADCPDPALYCAKADGDCDGVGTCEVAPINTDCPGGEDPVCGCDGVNYASQCDANAAGTNVDPGGNCPVICSDSGVCAKGEFCAKADGDCDGMGECQPLPQGCPAGGAEVCGCDGNTYPSLCDANTAGVNVDTSGACPITDVHLRADANSDGNVNLPDAQYLLNFLFLGGPDPKCMASADANGDSGVNLPDAQNILNFLFLGGSNPVAPFPLCGLVTPEDLVVGCATSLDPTKCPTP